MNDARPGPERFLPLLLVGLAFFLRTYHLDFQSLWRDEVDVLRFSTQPWPDLAAMFTRPGDNGPLFYLALRPWLAAAGDTEFALRFPSVLAGTLAVLVLYALMRRLAGQRPALLAALFAATAPFLTWYAQDAKMYALITALIAWTLWLAIEAIRRGRLLRWSVLYAFTNASFLIHVLAVLVLPVQAVWLMLLAPRQRAGRWRAALLYLALLLLPYLTLLGWTARSWLARADPNRYPFVSLVDMLALLVARFSQGILPGAPLIMLPSMLALVAGCALWPQLGGRVGRQTIGLLVAWLFLPLAALYGVSLRVPLFLDRYMIWTMPAFLGLVGLGVSALLRAWRPLGLATAGAILAFNLTGIWTQTHQPIKSDFRAAAQYVAAQGQTADRLIFQMPYNHFIFSYYFGELPGWVDGPYTNGGMAAGAVDDYLASQVGDARAAWLIASEAALWDQRGLTQSWLEAHGTLTAHAEFARVTVMRYQLQR